jgi:hypothetical protein
MFRRVLTLVVLVLGLMMAACGTDGAGDANGDAAGGACADADPAVVKQVMAGARSNFRPVMAEGETGVQIDHLELLDSTVGQLPKKDRKFGAEQLLVLKISTVLGGSDASDGFGSIEGTVLFALNADGKLLGPAGAFTASQFDLGSPTDPGWLAWGDKVEVSPFAGKLYGCVDPD